jgi:hypothetical protein
MTEIPSDDPEDSQKTADLFPCTSCSCPDFVEGNPLGSVICNRPTCRHNAINHGLN